VAQMTLGEETLERRPIQQQGIRSLDARHCALQRVA